ncbi:MAG: phosphatase PAP2 family protein [Pseudoflavonifractor sp.]|nr:phosphatase PAP2 family protein [Alloprevotella sp.]MCM1116388.1 phosphatase PAP2 family protein [Pseudoflavonifractor sp.]
MTLRLFSLFFFLGLLLPRLSAAQADSTAMVAFERASHPAIKPLVLPASLIALGAVGAATDWGVDREVADPLSSYDRRYRVADYLQWTPYAISLGAEYIGGKARCVLADRALLSASSFIILEAITQPLKRFAHRERPDRSDCHSFPSGHTATAFAGAELCRLAYGDALGCGAYLIASSVGILRIAANRHYFSDCLAGAGIGLLSARLAAWLLPWERKLFHRGLSPKPGDSSIALLPSFSVNGNSGLSLLISL